MIATVIGTTELLIEDEIVSVPSTAESTEIAGVIMLSPKNSAAPNNPSPASTNWRAPAPPRRSSSHEIGAMIPPSPSLSAPITQADVLDGDDQQDRPEDQGDDAEALCSDA